MAVEEFRAKRFVEPGHDRIYVYGADGNAIWGFDRTSGSERQFRRGLSKSAWTFILAVRADPDRLPIEDQPRVDRPAGYIAGGADYDLSKQRPGHALLGKLAELHATAFSNGSGVLSEEFVNFATGFVGEEIAARGLATLGAGWYVLHGVPIGDGHADIDHVVVGPPGVFTINTKHHPGGRVQSKGGDALFVGRTRQPYARKSRAEASGVADRLRGAGVIVSQVHPVIAVVGTKRVDARIPLDGVTLLAEPTLVEWLRQQPHSLGPAQIESIFTVARNPATWTTRGPVPSVPEWVAETARAVCADHVIAKMRSTAGRQRAVSTGRPHRAPNSRRRAARPVTALPAHRRKGARGRGNSTQGYRRRRALVIAVALSALLLAKPLSLLLTGIVGQVMSGIVSTVPSPSPGASPP